METPRHPDVLSKNRKTYLRKYLIQAISGIERTNYNLTMHKMMMDRYYRDVDIDLTYIKEYLLVIQEYLQEYMDAL